ncbi:MAG: hypothetical protein QM788_10290 [Roseateles sp.]|uniref:hypothetical protein n=1 Tax=Roseateles sp. TaxID=1971397 RepID=UPI0039EAAB8D
MKSSVQRRDQSANAPGEAQQSRDDPSQGPYALQALCVIARLHHIAAEPHALRHELGLGDTAEVSEQDLLLAAQRIAPQGLRTKYMVLHSNSRQSRMIFTSCMPRIAVFWRISRCNSAGHYFTPDPPRV